MLMPRQPRSASLTALSTNGLILPQGRLSLTTGLPVTVSDVTAAATIYYSRGFVPIWDGSRFVIRETGAELSLALDATVTDTGYHQSGKNFDIFAIRDAGTYRIATGPAWTSDTARGTGAGTTELEYKVNIRTNKVSMTARFGSATGNTVTVAANQGTYLGSVRMTATGQTEDSAVKRFLWNTYNRVPRKLLRKDTTDNWTYSTAAYQQANASAANQVEALRGLDEDAVELAASSVVINSTATTRTVYAAIGLDSTTVKASDSINSFATIANLTSAGARQISAHYRGAPGLGYHYLAWLEYGGGADTQTWYGDNAATLVQTGLAGWCMA